MVRQRHLEIKTKKRILPPGDAAKSAAKRGFGKWFFIIFASLSVILYVIVPVAFYLSLSIKCYAVFLNFVRSSVPQNLSFPKEMGLHCAQNFYIPSNDDIQIGTWYIPANEALTRCESNSLKAGEEFLDSRPVFLYFHGNTNTRGGNHRLQLYKMLSQKVNAHIIAFDYRGYGDSTNVLPSQHGVVNDSLHVYNWLRKRIEMKRIYIWGHSLGTGIATATLQKLLQSQEVPAGLILEAPFTNIKDAVKSSPFSVFHRYMPFFDFFIVNSIASETELFNSTINLSGFKSPILILHAEDDAIIPYRLGKELYEHVASRRQSEDPPIEFIGFEKKLGYGHKHIHKHPELPNIVNQFIEKTKSHVSGT